MIIKRNVEPFKGFWAIPGGHSVVLVFYAKTSGKARINEESLEFKWLSPEEAVRLKLGFSNSKIIRRWMGLKV